MKIVIFTQEENLYLPQSFSIVCDKLNNEITHIISSPAMSTHGGPIKGLLKHIALFGFINTLTISTKVITSKTKALLFKGDKNKKLHSIKNVAEAYKIPFKSVDKLEDNEFYKFLDKIKPDLLISISCPQIINKTIRDKFPKGCINVHGAPLPKYRGLMPAFWVLKNNEKHTASTVHDLGDKLDNGDILIQKIVPISKVDTWDSLVIKTKVAGAYALVEAVEKIREGTITRTKNSDNESTFFSFPTAKDRKEFFKAGRRFF